MQQKTLSPIHHTACIILHNTSNLPHAEQNDLNPWRIEY